MYIYKILIRYQNVINLLLKIGPLCERTCEEEHEIFLLQLRRARMSFWGTLFLVILSASKAAS